MLRRGIEEGLLTAKLSDLVRPYRRINLGLLLQVALLIFLVVVPIIAAYVYESQSAAVSQVIKNL